MTTPTPGRVLYVHGLEAGPYGTKSNFLRSSFSATHAVHMHTGTRNLRARNSFARGFLRHAFTTHPRDIRAVALADCLTRCVALQRDAIADFAPNLVVGSSWGGAVVEAMLAQGLWTGPTLLLCPALRAMERWAGPRGLVDPSVTPGSVEAAIAALPAEVRRRILVVHGDQDDTVPLSDSQQLTAASGLRLEVIPGASHSLGALVTSGQLRTMAEQLLAA